MRILPTHNIDSDYLCRLRKTMLTGEFSTSNSEKQVEFDLAIDKLCDYFLPY